MLLLEFVCLMIDSHSWSCRPSCYPFSLKRKLYPERPHLSMHSRGDILLQSIGLLHPRLEKIIIEDVPWQSCYSVSYPYINHVYIVIIIKSTCYIDDKMLRSRLPPDLSDRDLQWYVLWQEWLYFQSPGQMSIICAFATLSIKSSWPLNILYSLSYLTSHLTDSCCNPFWLITSLQVYLKSSSLLVRGIITY